MLHMYTVSIFFTPFTAFPLQENVYLFTLQKLINHVDKLGKHGGYTNERKIWTQYLVGYTNRLHILV